MKILLLARTIKSYWATDFAKQRFPTVFVPFDGSFLWRAFGGFFAPFLYFYVAFFGFLKSKEFDLVITSDPRIGIIFAILKKLLGSKKKLLVHSLILPHNIKGIKEKFFKFAFEEINAAIVFSSSDIPVFKKLFPKTRFFFMHFHSEPECFALSKKASLGDYIFSGGGAERDFKTLIDAARRINFKFLIVAFSPKSLPEEKLPKNVEVRFKLPRSRYLKLISRARIIVVPLKKVGRAAGQTTVVAAMSIGKAVIASDVPGLRDYVENNKTGILVKPQDVDELTRSIEILLKDSKKLKVISKNALKFARKSFTYEIYDKKHLRLLNP